MRKSPLRRVFFILLFLFFLFSAPASRGELGAITGSYIDDSGGYTFLYVCTAMIIIFIAVLVLLHFIERKRKTT